MTRNQSSKSRIRDAVHRRRRAYYYDSEFSRTRHHGYAKKRNLFSRIFSFISRKLDTPVGRPAKKVLITLVGVVLTLLGVVLIILPGPAFLLIPVGLAVLAIEYPSARKLLRKFQRLLTVWAQKADAFWARRKVRSKS